MVNRFGCACPLQPIGGGFHAARPAACATKGVGRYAASYIAHAAAETYHVGHYYAAVTAPVGQYHSGRIGIQPFFEMKTAQIDPSATRHGLIHLKIGAPAGMINRIMRIGYVTLRKRIGHRHHIVAIDRNVGHPLGKGFFGERCFQ